MIGDDLGEHGDHAIGQIHAGGPFPSLAIQRRLGRDEERDVGNVDAQSPMSLLGLLQRNRIVEVPRVGRIDRDHGQRGQIDAVVQSLRIERLRLLPRRFQHILGKRVRESVFADDRQGVDAGLAARSQHLGDHRFAVLRVGREADHLDHDDVVGPHVLRARIADRDRLGEQLAVDLDQRHDRRAAGSGPRTGACPVRALRRSRRARAAPVRGRFDLRNRTRTRSPEAASAVRLAGM